MSFEVLGSVLKSLPTGWTKKPLKYVTQMNPEQLPETTPNDTELLYVDIGNVNALGEIEGADRTVFAFAPTRARRVIRAGDCIISTVRTYLRAIARVDEPNDGWIVSTGFAVLRPTNEIDARFLLRVLQSEPFVQAVVANSEGVSYPAISPSKLARLPLWFPPSIKEQQEIASFLDRELAVYDDIARPSGKKVEGVGGEFQLLVNLMLERRRSLITAAVTGQLDIAKAA
jgi:type I restriction enzyme S subunit